MISPTAENPYSCFASLQGPQPGARLRPPGQGESFTLTCGSRVLEGVGRAEVRNGAPQEVLWFQARAELPLFTFPAQHLVSRLQKATQNSVNGASRGHLIPERAPAPAHPVISAATSPF